MVGKTQKSHGARSELNSVFGLEKLIGGTPLEHPPYNPDLDEISGLFEPRKGSSEARNFEVINGLQHVSKKCVVCQGKYFEKETVTAPQRSSASE
jgi:hypothetical protein